MSDISGFPEITAICALLDTYNNGHIDQEQLVGRLARMRDLASVESKDALSTGLSELIARIEMIHLNICRAERGHAIAGVIEDFKKSHL
jgi:hypothetical protein